MLHFQSFADVQLFNTWATIGMFDGVHRGHQAILAPLVSGAHAAGCSAAVVTFSPHPAVVLRGIQEPYYLSTPEERAQLLGGLGIDVVITLTFDRELAAVSAVDFMQHMHQHLGLRQLWVGSDFALGRNRQGDIPALRLLGEEWGYTVHVTPEITLDSTRISSTHTRALLKEGQVEQAARMLGRPYDLDGKVVHGEARGRTIGFPTANLSYWQQKITPGKGVYATWAWVAGQRLASVTNVGTRPTFDGVTPSVEAHLLNFEQDIYEQPMKLEFIAFLRTEQRFPSLQALKEQIYQDAQRGAEILAHAP